MATQEVSRIQAHLDDLDNEFSSRLTQDVTAKTPVEPYTL